jgi:hypothetical protein
VQKVFIPLCGGALLLSVAMRPVRPRRLAFHTGIVARANRKWRRPAAWGGCGAHAFQKMIFATDEGPQGLESNIERFERFLSANNVPEAVREASWEGTMAKTGGVTSGAATRP